MQTDDPELTIARLSALTPAEQAVLDQALTGVPAREIAEHLSLSEATVRSHLSSIYVKLGVSGRVALLAHFRGLGSDVPTARAEAPSIPRPRGVSVTGWSWGILALVEGAYAVYLVSHALAYGGSQTDWLLAIGFGILCVFGTLLARAILERPSRSLLLVSVAVAGGHLLFAVRGLFLGQLPPFMILGVLAIAIGWISFRAMASYGA
jgi:DNA-binding CsgD family transcriptional regulator